MLLGRKMAQRPEHGDATAAIIDEEIHDLLEDIESRAEKLLDKNRDRLEALAGALEKHETLERDQVIEILEISNSGDQ